MNSSSSPRRGIEFAIIGICGALALVMMALNANSPIAEALRKGERINGVLIGSDYEDYARHSDTLMFVSYDPHSRFLDLMSIPRDTMISIPDQPHVRRINEVFAYEFRHSGRDFNIASMALKGVVQNMLSSGTVNTVQIPYYFTIDYSGFRALIDAIGGVTVRVTEPMHYDDNWGKLHIHFEPGVHQLDGRKALEYVRFRGTSADQGRVLRQQLFVKEVFRRMKNPASLWRLPEYSKLVLSGFHANVSAWDLFTLFVEGRRVKWNNLRLFSLPGTPSGNFWKMHPENTQRILGLMKGPADLPHSITPEDHAAATVEVWNASSRANAAQIVKQMLRDRGFDVVLFGNFASRQQRTLVIDRSGHLRPAQAVANILKSVNPEVVSRVDPGRQVDVSVIIGNDFQVEDKKWPL